MINREHDLPITRQAELLGISRGAVYYRPEPVSPSDLALMRRIDELHLQHPFAGSGMMPLPMPRLEALNDAGRVMAGCSLLRPSPRADLRGERLACQFPRWENRGNLAARKSRW